MRSFSEEITINLHKKKAMKEIMISEVAIMKHSRKICISERQVLQVPIRLSRGQ